MNTQFRRKRVWILLLLACSVLAGTLFYIKYFISRPIGSGPAGPQVGSPPFKTPWTNRPIHIVAFGDSITAGLGANSLSHRYVDRLITNPPDEFPDMKGKSLSRVIPKLTSENHAVSGSTSVHHLAKIQSELKPCGDETFGVVFLTTGGNDIIHNYGQSPPREGAMYGATPHEAEPWIASFEARLEDMLALFELAFPGGHEVYLADIYDPTDGVGDAASIFLPAWPDGLEIHAQYNHVLNQVAGGHDNVFIVPLHRTFMGHGSHSQQFWRQNYDSSDPSYWYYTNIEDPNDRGYDAIRRVFLNTIIDNTTLIAR